VKSLTSMGIWSGAGKECGATDLTRRTHQKNYNQEAVQEN